MKDSQFTGPVSKLFLENTRGSPELTQLLQYIVEKFVLHYSVRMANLVRVIILLIIIFLIYKHLSVNLPLLV